MTADWIVYAYLAAGLASALVAGVFLTFSDFVMKALIAAEPAGGIEVMQRLNRTVFRSVFLALFIALAPVSIGLAIYAIVALAGPAAAWSVAAAVIYVPGVFLVTAFGNVPMNQRLDGMDHRSAEAADYWRAYGRVWTRWNHVRAVGSVATAACFLMAGVALA